MNEHVKVLVTGAGSLLGQGIIRALRGSSFKTTIAAVDPHPLAAGLYWVEAPYVVPPVREEEYLERIEEILSRERPDAVLVGTDVELGRTSSCRSAWAPRMRNTRRGRSASTANMRDRSS